MEVVVAAAVGLTLSGCKPSDILTVPPPPGVVAYSTLNDSSLTNQVFLGAKAIFFLAVGQDGGNPNGVVALSELLSDELESAGPRPAEDSVSARYVGANTSVNNNLGDFSAAGLISAYSALGQVAAQLEASQIGADGQSKVGEAFALQGYTVLYLAEDFCAGAPLTHEGVGGGVIYGHPIETDSMFGVAEGLFDSALKHVNGNPAVQALASVGRGRALVNRGRYDSAALAVAQVPTNFVYNAEEAPTGPNALPNIYATMLPATISPGTCANYNVPDRKGGNGLPYQSADDPRLVLDSTLLATCDEEVAIDNSQPSWADVGQMHYPVKFGNPSTYIPFATGVEARLIEAEAALQTSVAIWTSDLNTLRANAPNTYLALSSGLPALSSDSTIGASQTEQIDVMFRERAFWLFGTGTRLGDLRRLVRQYGRSPSTVFPVGTNPHWAVTASYLTTVLGQTLYGAGIPTYGSDVSLGLPQPGTTTTPNPYYKGCLHSTTTA